MWVGGKLWKPELHPASSWGQIGWPENLEAPSFPGDPVNWFLPEQHQLEVSGHWDAREKVHMVSLTLWFMG